jgi:hypothetical protein
MFELAESVTELRTAFGETLTMLSYAAKQAVVLRHRNETLVGHERWADTTRGSLTTLCATDTIARAATVRASEHLRDSANVHNQSTAPWIHACGNELTY